MPWKKTNIKQEIADRREQDSEFREAWDSSREEYRILGEITRMRKEKGLSQSALAEETGIKQQAISRIEKRENSPTLKTLCSLLDALGCELVIKAKEKEPDEESKAVTA